MTKRATRTRSKNIEAALRECERRLSELRRTQERYSDALANENVQKRKKYLRLFTEEHAAFLNAAYSIGDYLKRIVPRPFLETAVKPLMDEALVDFHRELRNAIDHEERIEFSRSYDINQVISISPSEVFPHPDVRVAMMHGAVNVQSTGKAGKSYLTYGRQHLGAGDAVRFDKAIASHGLNENPSVIHMAELYYERLLGFVVHAEAAGQLGKTT